MRGPQCRAGWSSSRWPSRPQGVDEHQWGLLPLLAGVAVADTLAAVGIRAGVKWPNDVLIDGAKIAGILAEVASPKPVVVLGIGLNVEVLPEEIGPTRAPPRCALGVSAERTEIARILLGELATRIQSLAGRRGRRTAGGLSRTQRHPGQIGACPAARRQGDRRRRDRGR